MEENDDVDGFSEEGALDGDDDTDGRPRRFSKTRATTTTTTTTTTTGGKLVLLENDAVVEEEEEGEFRNREKDEEEDSEGERSFRALFTSPRRTRGLGGASAGAGFRHHPG